MRKLRSSGCAYAKLRLELNCGLNSALLLVVVRLKLFNASENEPPPHGTLCAMPPLKVMVSLIVAVPLLPSCKALVGSCVTDCGPIVDVRVGL